MYTGLTGKLEVKVEGENAFDGEVAYISNWSVEDTSDIIEVTKLGGNFKEKHPGLQSWSASADGTVVFSDAGQKALFAAKHAGAPVSCSFYLNTETGTVFTGTGYIESLSVDLSAEDKGNISISINGDGELKYPVQ